VKKISTLINYICYAVTVVSMSESNIQKNPFCFQFLCIVHFWEVGQWLPSDLETVSGIPVARRLVSGLPVAWMLVSGFPLAWRLISGFPLTWRTSVDFSGY
jgi:hypothetical protein